MKSKQVHRFDLEKYFKKSKKKIDTAFNKYLPKESEYPPSIHKAMRYSIFAGGKRLRAMLVLAASEIFSKNDVKNVLPIACAVEMIHTYSLIHDDLPCIDNDDFRRGKPSTHKVFGEAVAVLAGDALLTHAFYTISRYKKIKPEVIIKVIQVITKAISTYGMIGGQIVDIESSGHEIDPETLEYIHVHKTSALLRACVYSGALLSGANSDELKYISNYGNSIGLAFQIVDDILDIEGDTKILGKKAGSDISNQRNTYPGIFGIKESQRLRDRLIKTAIANVQKLGPKAENLAAIAIFIRDRKF